MPEPCQHVKTDGRRCRAQALPGKAHCFWHDPDSRSRVREAGVAGGRARAKARAVLPADAPDLALKSVADVIDCLGATINQVRKGQLDAKVANAVGYLANVLLTALKVGPLEERMNAIEARLNEGAR